MSGYGEVEKEDIRFETLEPDAVFEDVMKPMELDTKDENILILLGRNVDITPNPDGTIDYMSRKGIHVEDDFVPTLLSRMNLPKKALHLYSFLELADANNRTVRMFYNKKTHSAQLATNTNVPAAIDALLKKDWELVGDGISHVALRCESDPRVSYQIKYDEMGYREAWYNIDLADGRVLKAHGKKPTKEMLPLIGVRVNSILSATASVREAIMGGIEFVEAADTRPLGVVTLTEIPDNTRSILPSGVPLIDICLSSWTVAKNVISNGPDLPTDSEEEIKEKTDDEA